MGLLGLRPRLEEDLGDATAADELAQTFLVALDMVHSAAADAGLDVAVDPEVTALLSLARDRLLLHASVAWLEHSPHLVAGREEALHSSVIAAPPAPLDVPGGYVRLTEYRLQVEAGTMSHAEFEAHRSAILMADPGLGLPSSLVVSSPLLQLSMEPPPVGESGSPAGVLSELFSNQTLQSPALRAATAAPSPSEVAAAPSEVTAASVTSGSRSHRPTAEPGPSADPVPPHGVKRGCDFPLMDVAQIPGYIRCLACIQRKVKCAPFVGSVPPYSCSHCVSVGRECLCPAAGRARGRTGAAGPSTAGLSGAAASSSLRLPASAFFGPEVPTLGVALAATVMFWRGEVARNLATRRALDMQLSFAEWQYAHFLGALVEPDPTTSQLPRKRARTGASRGRSGKGKEKAIDVDALSDSAGNAEAMDDAADSAGAGADGVDETSWAGFSANFGMEITPSKRPVQLGMPGLTESTRALRTTIEEAAAPHAELEWLLLFPGVFEEHPVVITNVVFGRNIAPLRNPYILAIAEFRDMFEDGVIDLDELQWQEERLGRTSLLADIRRRESASGGDALTNSG
ncbi:hypothetical protein EDB89DRAFT_2077716 [Lactarius sanguifluus]|nr:hypothetical protein EDB89DRAFT_2077716 [Lactarius sanguifluus]